MNGQGRPILGLAPSWYWWSARIMLWFAAFSYCANTHAQAESFRLHIVWGGQQPRLWHGSISLSRGTFSELKLLGLDADQPGSLINQGGNIRIAPRRAHRFDGLEVLATAPEDDVLRIELTPDNDAEATRRLEIPFAELKHDTPPLILDEQKNSLRVTRAPGDLLRIQFQRDSLVFSPGEPWSIDLVPHHVGIKPGTSVRARLRLRSTNKTRLDVTDLWKPSDDDLWSREENLRVADNGKIDALANIDVRIPREEGVYELVVELFQRRALTMPFTPIAAIAKRRLQFVVIDPHGPMLPSGGPSTLVTEFNPADPTDPRWYERLTQLPQWKLWKLLPRTRPGPWSYKPPEIWNSNGKSYTRLPSDGWIAYPLPIAKVGVLHVLDIEFPEQLPQHIGISILEANAAGKLTPVGLDSGLSIGDPDLTLSILSSPAGTVHHRLVFWPSTTSPVVLITNRQPTGSVVFGRLRLEAFHDGLPLARPRSIESRQRLAFLDRPLLTKNLLAPEAFDPGSSSSLEDWNTFYEAGRRLIAYLRFAGYDGLALAAACEGSSLYPSEYLEPTPKYDHGVFFSSGQDARRKDVLEMLFRLFDREGLTLIPSLEFATPLPVLEQELARGARSAEGIELKSAGGLTWLELHASRFGLAPYYNPLDSRVQSAMLSVVDELTSRYARHASFGGVNLNMSAHGFTQLPDVEWGLDHRTFLEFQKAVQMQVDGANAPEFEQHLRDDINNSVLGQRSPLQAAWLAWRAERLGQLYQKMARLVRARSNSPLYISTAPLIKTAPWQRHLRPALLPRRMTINDAMLEIGLDANLLRREPALVLLRPHRLAPLVSLGPQAVNLAVAESTDVEVYFADESRAASQFYHEPQTLRLESFDQHGPFDHAYTLLLSHFQNAGQDARRHFAHSLALHDDQMIFAGGQLLPMGQEHALGPFFDVFRQLPGRPFQTLSLEGKPTPVVVRTLSEKNQTFAYFVNDSPWPVRLRVTWEAPVNCIVDSLGSQTIDERTQVGGLGSGRLAIGPYELAALRFSSPQVKLRNCKTVLPAGRAAELFGQIGEISSRADQLEQQVAQEGRIPVKLLEDQSLEKPLGIGPHPAWTISQRPDSSATIDRDVAAAGSSSLRLTSSGPAVVVTSHAFKVPQTGRLLLSVQLRRSDPNQVPGLVVRLETNHEQYQPFHRFKKGQLTTKFDSPVRLHLVDVPADPNLQMKVSFELLGAGEVWIDDIQLYDKWFEPGEINALFRILHIAYVQQKSGDLSGCYQTLSGYWPRFLLRHVPPAEAKISSLPREGVATRPRRETASPPKKRTMFDWLKIPSFR